MARHDNRLLVGQQRRIAVHELNRDLSYRDRADWLWPLAERHQCVAQPDQTDITPSQLFGLWRAMLASGEGSRPMGWKEKQNKIS
jgi:hypothetical protein